MQKQEYINEITHSLATLETKIRLFGANNLTDINLHAEDLYCGLLNLVFDYQLKNLNTEQENFPGADLGDPNKKLAIQVTSDTSLAKVRKSITKFVKHKKHEDYDRLVILNLVEKPQRKRQKIRESDDFQIDTKDDIWDNYDIIKAIQNLNDLDKLKSVHDYLKSHLSPDKNTENLAPEETVLQTGKLLLETNENNHQLLQSIAAQVGVPGFAKLDSVAATQDSSNSSSPYDPEIDGYRDLLNSGQPRTALNLLESLQDRLPKDIEPRITYRVKANIAACHLKMDNEELAGKEYIAAYKDCPDAPKADAHNILGLVLLDKPEEALEFSKIARKTTEDLESLIVNTIQALKYVPKEKQSLDLIPESMKDNEDILVSKIDYLRSIESREEWRQEAIRAYNLHPKNKVLRRFYAESILDKNFEEWDKNLGNISIVERIDEINDAIKILEECLKETQNWEYKDGYYLSLVTNLSLAYRLIDRHEDAAAILDEALKIAPKDQSLIESRAMIAFETHDTEKSKELFDLLPQTRDTILGRIQVSFNDRDWETVCSLPQADKFLDFSEDDKAFYEIIQFVAGYKKGNIDKENIKEKSKHLIRKYPDKVIVPIALFQVAYEIKDQEWADELYNTAKKLQNNASISTRLMLADVSTELGDYENVISLFEDKILTDRDSPPLRLLTTAYVNTPIKQRAVDFVESLDEELLNTPFYARAKASIHYNHGDLETAQKSFSDALRAAPNEVALHMGYLQTLLRKDRQKQAHHHIKQIKLERLTGPSFMKLGIAQFLVGFGEESNGINYGYEVALENQGNERAVLLYMGLILPNSSLEIPKTFEKVEENCWITLRDEEGKETNFIISNIDKPEFDHYTPDHDLSKLLLEKSIGETITHTPTMGTEKKYTISSIKHRYIGLLHTLMNAFPKRFPHSKKIFSYTTKEGDVQPILDDIKKMSEAEEQVYKLYIEQKLPLAFLSDLSRFNVIELANKIISLGHNISTNIGTNEEKNIGFNLSKKASGNGIVLDTYTLWFAYTKNLIPCLKKKFKRILIPQSCIDDLQEWRSSFENQNKEPLLTVGYANGQHFREEISAEQLQNSYDYINEAIQYFVKNIEVMPTAQPHEIGKLEEELINIQGNTKIFDAAYLAQKENILLLSEDMSYRAIAKEQLGVDGVWLQVVLMDALQDKTISPDEYTEAISALALHKHSHLSLSAPVLFKLCLEDQTLQKYKNALEFIGTPDADVDSHISVSIELINYLWSGVLDHLTKCKATSLLLRRLAIMADKNNAETALFTNLANSLNSDISEYIKGWFFGHYFIKL